MALPGVWNWRGTIGKTGGPNGERLDIKGPIPDLSRIAWKNRTVYVVFDSNADTNENVGWARKGIARELASRSAKVQLVNLPGDGGVNGVDDLLAAWGPARVLELFHNSVSGPRHEVTLSPEFRSRAEGIFRVTSKSDQLIETRLTNFCAVVTANVRLDNGAEMTREFEIEAELIGRKHRFTIDRLTHIRALVSSDIERARVELAKHVTSIILQPVHDHYQAAGEWNLLGKQPTLGQGDEMRVWMVAGDGFEPPTFGL
jgi:hypothetical protein